MAQEAAQAAKGTSVLMFQSVLTGFFRVLNLSLLTRLLLQEQMGQVAILGVIYGFLQFLGAAGLNHASPLFVPEQEAAGKLGRVKGFLKQSLGVVAASSSAIAVFILAAFPFFLGATTLSADLLLLAIIVGPFSSLEVFLDSFLLARYEVKELAAGRTLFNGVRLVGTVALVFLGWDVVGVMLGWLLAEIVAVLVFGYAAVSGIDVKSKDVGMTSVLSFGLPSLAFQTIDVTIQNTDRIILLQLTNLSALAVYDVFLRILFMFSLVSLTVSSATYPILTRIRVGLENTDEVHESGKSMGEVVTTLVRYILILLFPAGAILALNSHAFLQILFGAQYANYPGASLSFSILVFSYVVWGVVYGLHAVLRSMEEKMFFVVTGIAVIGLEIVGCWFLISWFGLLGCALIRCSYIFILLLTSVGRLWQKGVRGFSSIAKPVVRITGSSLIAGLVTYFIAPPGLIGLALIAVLSLGVYLLLLIISREPRELDFRIARSLLPSVLHWPINKVENILFEPEKSEEETA
ncbi:MAG: oligosaccharide flippase family protein [Candidatus Lokiarchaeota archaeon]|nr:oligosaccharide flippase family protein [Candidatus Lokiarchaeota archaeon]